MEKLKILLPKGRIYENVVELFSGAGIGIRLPDRAYRPVVNQDDLEAKVMKPQNIGKLLELGAHDVGFTGRDWIEETGADVEEVMDLGFDRVRIVAAVRRCFQCRPDKDVSALPGIFSGDVVCSECHGPEYRGFPGGSPTGTHGEPSCAGTRSAWLPPGTRRRSGISSATGAKARKASTGSPSRTSPRTRKSTA